MVYDFPIKKSGSIIKNRKKGFNANDFWKHRVSVKSNKRKKYFCQNKWIKIKKIETQNF